MDKLGLLAFIARQDAALSSVAEAIAVGRASLRAARLDVEEITFPLSLGVVWQKNYPKGKYPSVPDWAVVRAALARGDEVLAWVGASYGEVFVVLHEISGEAVPLKASYLDAQRQPAPLCPAFGPNPNNSVWYLVILGHELGA